MDSSIQGLLAFYWYHPITVFISMRRFKNTHELIKAASYHAGRSCYRKKAERGGRKGK